MSWPTVPARLPANARLPESRPQVKFRRWCAGRAAPMRWMTNREVVTGNPRQRVFGKEKETRRRPSANAFLSLLQPQRGERTPLPFYRAHYDSHGLTVRF